MRADQRHDSRGQYTQRQGYDMPEGERLEYPIGCKVAASELRRYTIMFDQCRKQFGWQTMSDMYRALIQTGYKDATARLKKPTEAMLRMARDAEELETIEAGAMKHKQLGVLLERVHADIKTALHAGDLAEVRRQLVEVRAKTKTETDAAIKQRRVMEWDARYAKLWDGLNRNMSLRPEDFEPDNDAD